MNSCLLFGDYILETMLARCHEPLIVNNTLPPSGFSKFNPQDATSESSDQLVLNIVIQFLRTSITLAQNFFACSRRSQILNIEREKELRLCLSTYY